MSEHFHHQMQHIHNVVSSKEFLNMEALGGEIPFWIAPYDPRDENNLVEAIPPLQNKLHADGVPTLHIELFELACHIIDQQMSSGIESLFPVEQRKKKQKFKGSLQSLTDIHRRFIPAMVEKVVHSNAKVLLLSGVGGLYPFMRSHTILNNLQSAVSDLPVLLFYPGEYTGTTLRLFNRLTDDNYYRAYNIHAHQPHLS